MNTLPRLVRIAGVATALATGLAGSALAQNGPRSFGAELDGYQEVPSLSTTGVGRFSAQLSADGNALDYTLEYRDLEGGETIGAHIHLGQTGVNGGVVAFLCGGGGAPPCPAGGGTVTGTVDAGSIIGPAGQGIGAGEFDELVDALRSGATYVNVHTDLHPPGEIRGQIDRGLGRRGPPPGRGRPTR